MSAKSVIRSGGAGSLAQHCSRGNAIRLSLTATLAGALDSLYVVTSKPLRSLEGCTNSVPSCCRLIVFVQQPAKSISPTHPCINGKRRPLELSLLRCLKL
jgi:hypothetical protein